jgi:hypothetical protein
MPDNKSSAARASARTYVRIRDLPRLLPLWPHEIEVESVSEHAKLLARMRRALRLERQRGRAGHWAYDLGRHAQLLRAYRAEVDHYLQRTGARHRAQLGAQRRDEVAPVRHSNDV